MKDKQKTSSGVCGWQGYNGKMLKEKFFNFSILVVQFFCYLLLCLPLRLYFKAQRHLGDNISDLGKGSLVVCNHQSKIDPFFILACLPFRVFMSLLPVRFPVLDEYYSSSWYNSKIFPFLTLLGCFPVGEEGVDRMKSVFFIRSLLKKGVTVLIFPEGKLVKDEKVEKLHQGINFFFKDAAEVVFVRIFGLNGVYHLEDVASSRSRIVFSKVYVNPETINFEQAEKYLNDLQ